MSSKLSDLILLDSPKLMGMANDLTDISWKLIPAVFLIAAIGKYFTDLSWNHLLKKLFISCILLSFYTSFHMEASKESINLAEETILLNSRVDLDLFNLSSKEKRAVKKVKENISKKDKGLFETIKAIPDSLFSFGASLAKVDSIGLGYILPVLVNLFSWISFLVVKLVYSGVYHLTYIFVGLVALIYLFDFGNKAIIGMLISTVWCMVFPFVLCTSIFFLGTTIGEVQSGDLGLMNLAISIVSASFVIFAPLITLKLITGVGIVEGIAQWGVQVGTGAIAFGGAIAMGALKNKGISAKSMLGNNADNIRESKGLTLDQAKGGFIRSQRNGLSIGERMVLGADTVMRPIVNGKRNRATKFAAKQMIKKGVDSGQQLDFKAIQQVDPTKPIADRGNQIIQGSGISTVEPEYDFKKPRPRINSNFRGFGSTYSEEVNKYPSSSGVKPTYSGSYQKNEKLNRNNKNIARPRISENKPNKAAKDRITRMRSNFNRNETTEKEKR